MKKFAYILLLLACTTQLFAQVQFTAQANRYKVGVGEMFIVEFKINANSSDFKLPSFQDFKIVGGPSHGQSTSYINGVRSMEKSVRLDLMALKKGTYTIGAAKTEANGDSYTTKPITITVVDAGTNQPGSIEEKAAQLVYINILTNKNKVYLGEPISVRYTLILNANVGQFEYLETPEFLGFVKNDIEIKQIQTKQETINGNPTTTADLSKFLLIPQQVGEFDLGKLQMRLPTQIPTGRRDWFGNPETRTINQISTSKFPKITVLPLPNAGKPASFNGAVGNFELKTSLSRNEVKGGESVTLTVEVSGKGNIQLIELPEPQVPNSIESYDPKYKESINVLPTGVKGYKRNEYLLIPQYKGVYKIPGLTFSFFNPYTEQYETQTTEELLIDVTEGEIAKTNPSQNKPINNDKNEVTALGEDIGFIQLTPSEFELKGPSFFVQPLHYILAIALFLATLGLFVYNRIRQKFKPDYAAKARKNAGSNAKKQLKLAHQKLQANQIKEFYGELLAALQKYFQFKANLAPADFNTERVAEIINQKQKDGELAQSLTYLINQANSARYAPLTQANMKQDYDLGLKSLEKLEDLL